MPGGPRGARVKAYSPQGEGGWGHIPSTHYGVIEGKEKPPRVLPLEGNSWPFAKSACPKLAKPLLPRAQDSSPDYRPSRR